MKKFAAIFCFSFLVLSLFAAPKPPRLQFDAAKGEQRTLTLLDGSQVTYTAYEGMSFVTNVEDPTYQTINIFIPEGATQLTPIFLRTYVDGYMEVAAGQPHADDATGRALQEGLVVVIPGSRGRQSQYKAIKSDSKVGIRKGKKIHNGRAPKALLDLKAAIRYLRFFDTEMLGNAERIIIDGTGAGGALAALVGATGNNPAYEPMLKAMGAAPCRDDVFAVVSYCPVIDLDHADMAYEWLFNGTRTRQNAPADILAISNELKKIYPPYLKKLALRTSDSTLLNADNYLDYLKKQLIHAAQVAKDAGADIPDSIGFVFNQPVAVSQPVGRGDRIIDLDLNKFLDYLAAHQSLKTAPAFDTKGVCGQQPSAENEEFGDEKGNALNFTTFSCEKTSTLLTSVVTDRVALMNPMNFIGDGVSTVAPHWYIRHGTHDCYTAFPIPINLALKLQNTGKDVNFLLAWNRTHTGDYALDDLFHWLSSLLKHKSTTH